MLLYERKYNDASRAICAGHHASYDGSQRSVKDNFTVNKGRLLLAIVITTTIANADILFGDLALSGHQQLEMNKLRIR